MWVIGSTVLLYADNTVFAAETVQEMQALLTFIENCANKWRLRANPPKSQVVYFLLSWGEYVDNLKSSDEFHPVYLYHGGLQTKSVW